VCLFSGFFLALLGWLTTSPSLLLLSHTQQKSKPGYGGDGRPRSSFKSPPPPPPPPPSPTPLSSSSSSSVGPCNRKLFTKLQGGGGKAEHTAQTAESLPLPRPAVTIYTGCPAKSNPPPPGPFPCSVIDAAHFPPSPSPRQANLLFLVSAPFTPHTMDERAHGDNKTTTDWASVGAYTTSRLCVDACVAGRSQRERKRVGRRVGRSNIHTKERETEERPTRPAWPENNPPRMQTKKREVGGGQKGERNRSLPPPPLT
jgi:hypothetical protein